jgi:hypothetical protein
MVLRLSAATSEDRESAERHAPNPHFETLQGTGRDTSLDGRRGASAGRRTTARSMRQAAAERSADAIRTLTPSSNGRPARTVGWDREWSFVEGGCNRLQRLAGDRAALVGTRARADRGPQHHHAISSARKGLLRSGSAATDRHKQRKEAPARVAAATPIDATMINSSATASLSRRACS